MYQVVELYGNFEPWWFLDDWQDDIIATNEFETFEEALLFFKHRWRRLWLTHPYYRSQASLLSAFWDKGNQSWCDDCEESLQEFRSLALLCDWEELSEAYHLEMYNLRNDKDQQLTACQLKKIG